MVGALVFVSAIGSTLMAAYQWAGRLGAFGEVDTELAVRDWQGRAWSTVLAIILWLIWLFLQIDTHDQLPTMVMAVN